MEAFSQTSLPDFQITQSICENLLKSNAKGVHVHTHTQAQAKAQAHFFLKKIQSFSPTSSQRVQSRQNLDLNLGPGYVMESGRRVLLEPKRGFECVWGYKHLSFHFSKARLKILSVKTTQE